VTYNYGPSTREIAATLAAQIPDLDTRRAVEMSLCMAPDIVRCVKAFHRLYEMPILRPSEARDDFSHITPERLAMRFGLIVEEFKELCREGMDIKVECKFSYLNEEGEWVEAKDHVEAVLETENRDLPQVADACVDLCYVIVGFCLEMGIDFHAVLEEVQASNMTKMGDDGQPLKRADGKILKGPSYVEANVERALQGRGLVTQSLGPMSAPRGMEEFIG
jgi:predicted HAD superfamily Cof-like phosphohydrolase